MTFDAVVVTCTRMRGATAATLSSPIRVVDREEIYRSGYATTGDVIRSLPQAFSGNQNVGAFPISGMAPENNFSAASSADLRGLGPGATLTLLNGRRLAYNGYANTIRSEEHTSELQSLMRISYAVFCLKKKNIT